MAKRRSAPVSLSDEDRTRIERIRTSRQPLAEHVRRAERDGWKIAGCYKNPAISGDSVIRRSGIQELLEDSQQGQFRVLIAETLNRVSRH